ncbi:MAG: carboxypeptidase family protein [Alphaproteobacteria bacterium]|nr:carboxypeptidase family protein [Alphaproteobacteria bacterium]
MAIEISTAFDSGNADLLAPIETAGVDARTVVRLAITPDHRSEHYQWFHFRVSGARGLPLALQLENASKASYPKAWPGTQAVRSVDRETWVRVPTDYVDGHLVIHDTPPADLCWYAYFAPYSQDRHQDLLGECLATGRARAAVLGRTLDGRDLDRLIIGSPGPGTPVFWVIGRQHPGESMASFWMEGFLERLLDADDAQARRLRERAVIHVVPMMNPDGAIRGHLRTNAAGANLNREWHAPTMERSPEVALVRDEMDRTGVQLCLDVHGDEALPYVFLAGAEGIPGWTAARAAAQQRFCDAYERACPDVQQVHGYPVDKPGEGNLSMCTNQVAHRFGAVSLTLEMPFKDNADAPEPIEGWSPRRCTLLGAAAVDALVAMLP